MKIADNLNKNSASYPLSPLKLGEGDTWMKILIRQARKSLTLLYRRDK